MRFPGVAVAALLATGCGGRATVAVERPADASSESTGQQMPATDASPADTMVADSAGDLLIDSADVSVDTPTTVSTEGGAIDAQNPQDATQDARFQSGYSPLDLADNCPSSCDTTSVCVDDGVEKTCAKSCRDNFDCPASMDCCTILTDGTGACLDVGSTGLMPGQHCLCAPSGPMGSGCQGPCSPALDTSGHPTGPDVCMP
jgi:hypothetical protein